MSDTAAEPVAAPADEATPDPALDELVRAAKALRAGTGSAADVTAALKAVTAAAKPARKPRARKAA